MLKPIENAEKLYNSFINKQNEKDFFIGFYDYFSYLERNPDIFYPIEKIILNRNKLLEDINKLEQKTIKELLDLKNKIVKIAPKKLSKEISERIKIKFQSIDDLLEGKHYPSIPKPSNIIRDIVDVLETIKIEDEALAEQFCDFSNTEPRYLVRIKEVCLPDFRIWEKALSLMRENEKASIEGSILRIVNLYEHIKPMLENNAYSQTPTEENTYLLLRATMSGWTELMNGKKTSYLYDKSKHLYDIERLHNFITINFDENLFQNPLPKTDKDCVYFDEKSSKIIYNEKTVSLVRGSNIFHTIKYIFSRNNLYEECFYDEIKDSLDKSKNISDKNIYDSLLQFKDRLVKKNVKDLLIINSRSVIVNPEYKVKSLHDKTR